MLSNVECHVTCKFTVRNRGREREQNPEFELSGYYIFCVRIPTNEMGRKNIYVKREREIRKKKKNASQPTEFKNEFLQKQKCTRSYFRQAILVSFRFEYSLSYFTMRDFTGSRVVLSNEEEAILKRKRERDKGSGNSRWVISEMAREKYNF